MDPYKILGVNKNSSKEEIKSAYRKLAKDYHPDANGGNDSKFKQINEAYEILTNSEQININNLNPNDIFAEFMKQHGFYSKIKPKRHGADINVRMFISLLDSFLGKEAEISLDRAERIDSEKIILKNRKIKVNIPAGIKNSRVLVLKGQGHQGINGGLDGNLNLIIEIKNDKKFIRIDNDLQSNIYILFTEAILGSIIKFKNINDEEIDVIIPKFSHQGQKIEIKDKGMPVGNSTIRGNLILIINIEMPKYLTEKQLDTIRNLSKE